MPTKVSFILSNHLNIDQFPYRHPYFTTEAVLEPWYPLFRPLNEGLWPTSFAQWVKEYILPSKKELESKQLKTFNTATHQLSYAVVKADVTQLAEKIPTVPFSLAIMDVPYGLEKEE